MMMTVASNSPKKPSPKRNYNLIWSSCCAMYVIGLGSFFYLQYRNPNMNIYISSETKQSMFSPIVTYIKSKFTKSSPTTISKK